MKKKIMKNKLKYLILLLLIFFIAVLAYKIVKLNLSYPNPTIENYAEGTAEKVKNGITMTVNSSRMISKKESEKEFGSTISNSFEIDDEETAYKIVEVDITLKNISSKKKKFSLYYLYIENNIYKNGLAPAAFSAINNGTGNTEVVLKPGKSQTVKLGYVLYKIQFSDKQWKNIDETTFYLVYDKDRYPVRKRWTI